jgi:hypothetical protein
LREECHVRGPLPAKKAVSVVSAATGAASGRLIHQATTGETSQSSKTGAHHGKAAGRPSARANATARLGANHISTVKSARVRRALRRA